MAVALTYFIGATLFLISSRQDEFFRQYDADDYKEGKGTLYAKFGFEEKSIFEQIVISQYYTLTILSIVGYGDYVPVSDLEMILVSVI